MWSSYGAYVELIWSLCGAHMELMWSSYGGYVGLIWSLCGAHMELMWSSYGAYMGLVHMEFMWSNIIFSVEYYRILQYLYCLSCSAIQKPFTYFWVDYGRFQAGAWREANSVFHFPMISGYTVVRAIYVYIYIYMQNLL